MAIAHEMDAEEYKTALGRWWFLPIHWFLGVRERK
jgi:hypothetical protein